MIVGFLAGTTVGFVLGYGLAVLGHVLWRNPPLAPALQSKLREWAER